MNLIKANSYYKTNNSDINFKNECDNNYIFIKKLSTGSSYVLLDSIRVRIDVPFTEDVLSGEDLTNSKNTKYFAFGFDITEFTQEEIINSGYIEITKEEYEDIARLAIMNSYETLKSSSIRK